MRFLMEFSNYTYMVQHGLAKALGKLYPWSSFIALIGPHQKFEKYLRLQKDIKYEFLYGLNELPLKILEQEVDYNELRTFEETLPEKSLWRFIACDRDWGWQFVESSYRPINHIYRINTNDNVIKVVSGYIRFYREAFEKYRPDVVLPAIGMCSISCPVLEQFCKNNNIPYLVPDIIRVFNYMAITTNRDCTFPQINKTYQELIEGKTSVDLSKGQDVYNKIILNEEYFNKPDLNIFEKPMSKSKLFGGAILDMMSEILNWIKGSKNRKQKHILHRQDSDVLSFMSNIIYILRRRYQKYRLLNPKMYSEYNPNQKYIYFPLQITPEYSTQVKATMWVNQLVIIEALAKSIPIGWKVYVKEHPGMVIASRVRDSSFYHKIKRYSNVELIPLSTDSHQVIENAQLVVNISGTTGWEAVLKGVPVINITGDFYDILELSTNCSDLEKLSRVIHDEIIRMKKISPEERKKRLIYFLVAALKHAFWIDNPLFATGNAICDEGEAERMGTIIGDKIKEVLSNSLNLK